MIFCILNKVRFCKLNFLLFCFVVCHEAHAFPTDNPTQDTVGDASLYIAQEQIEKNLFAGRVLQSMPDSKKDDNITSTSAGASSKLGSTSQQPMKNTFSGGVKKTTRGKSIKRILSIPHYDNLKKPLFALKTNLLYDAVSVINLEIELPIGQSWSVAGEFIFPLWLLEKKQYCLQLTNGSIEARFWLGERAGRRPLTGWFAGIYAGAGYYDIETGKKGYQGEHFMAGLSGGYAHPVNKKNNLRMEYSLGAGYFASKYRSYTPEFGIDDEWHLMRRKNGKFSWVGPAKAKISLVWLLQTNKKHTRLK